MKILYYDWDSLAQQDMVDGFKKQNNEVVLTTYRCMNYEDDPLFEANLNDDLDKDHYDFVFSFNYFPTISKVCDKRRIPYVSWVFDSPHFNVFSHTLKNPCNLLFHFDGYYCEWLKKQGYLNVHHLPLAANVERLERLLGNPEADGTYLADVSFVGRLYDKKNLYDAIHFLPDYLKGYFDGVMQSQSLIYGYNFLQETLTEDIMRQLGKYVKLNLGNAFFFDEKFIFTNTFLSQKVTSIERIKVLDALSKSMNVTLFSDSGHDVLPNVTHSGCVDAETNAPKVYRGSKVNLNVTLRSIITGVPLRVFEILGSGGFLISNYQAELTELFVPGEDVVIYEDWEDLKRKASYYLEHEAERKEMSVRAYQKMKEFHTFDKRIQTMMEMISKPEAFV